MLLCCGRAQGQAIERNLPPQTAAAPPVILTPKLAPQDQDDRALGPRLAGVTVLGPIQAVSAGASPGVNLTQSPKIDSPSTRRALTRLLGRPLSRKLIAQVEALIVRDYRQRGYPFVSVSTPEQDISSGVLQVRTIVFRLEKVSAAGANSPAYVESRVRAAIGQPIDTDKLGQDLDWLNRDPFRKSEAVFQPGAQLGDTDLILKTTESKPWSVYAGYSNSGSPLTGLDRYFAGATFALPFLHDAYASYQFTGSNDVLFSQDRPLNGSADPLYLSHSGRIVIPTLPRQDIEATVSYVQSNEFGTFTAHQATEEASLGYRTALSNLLSILPGEAVVGVEARRETGRTIFADEPVQSGNVDVFQVYVSYSGQEVDPLGRTLLDLTVHISPGGVTDRNTDAAFAAASQGRSTSAQYAYLSGDITRSITLPKGFGYTLSLIGQYAPNPLPLTEQIGLGGPSLVRGYTLDDGVFDSGLLARNEVRAPAGPVIGRFTKAIQDGVQPFAFLDAGYGKNDYTHADSSPIGAGFGADYQLGQHLSASLTTAWALKREGLSHAGEFRLQSRVAVTF